MIFIIKDLSFYFQQYSNQHLLIEFIKYFIQANTLLKNMFVALTTSHLR
jgi:hypothetical protein